MFSVQFALTECTESCEISSSGKQIALSFGNLGGLSFANIASFNEIMIRALLHIVSAQVGSVAKM